MIISLIRTSILYTLVIIGIRLLGKRQIGELEPSEFVLALLIADLASVPMQDNGTPLLSGVIPIVTLLCLTMILSIITMKSMRARRIVCGAPSVIVENGTLNQREMQKNRFTADELAEELRIHGVTDISTVKYGILETNGKFSVLLSAAQQPATAEQVQAKTEEGGIPIILVNDGRIMDSNLKHRGLNRAWLEKRLKERNIKHIKEVFLLTLDEQDRVFFARKEVV